MIKSRDPIDHGFFLGKSSLSLLDMNVPKAERANANS